MAPQKKSWRSQAQIGHQLDRPSATTSKRSDRKHKDTVAQDFDYSCIAVFRAWRFWASSAHPREVESDSFLACAAKTTQRLAAARTRPCTRSLSSTVVVVNRLLRDMLRYSDRKNKKTLTIYVVSRYDANSYVCFHQIELNSTRFLKHYSFRFKSVLR